MFAVCPGESVPKDYQPTAEDMARARALVEAVDIAQKIRSTRASTPELLLESYAIVKQAALTPELWGPDPMTASSEGLIGLERLFLNYWNTVSGAHVDCFWQLVAERGLPFQRRKFVARGVLDRGHCEDAFEHQHAKDGLEMLQQTREISAEDADRLGMMLRQFEQSGTGRP